MGGRRGSDRVRGGRKREREGEGYRKVICPMKLRG